MRARFWLLIFFWVVSVGTAHAMERNAFLNRPASTTRQLVEQVEKDPVVADRFMRHYAMRKKDLVRFLSGLRPSMLRMGGEFTVYSCLPSGQIRSRILTLKPGTRIFVNSKGVPVLKMSCGNPMSWRVDSFKEPTSVPVVLEPLVAADIALRENSPFETAAVEPEELYAEVPDEVAAIVPSVPEMSFGEWPELVASEVAPSAPVAAPSFGWGFLPLLLLPSLDFGGGGPVIPEPSVTVAVAVALALLARKHLGRSR